MLELSNLYEQVNLREQLNSREPSNLNVQINKREQCPGTVKRKRISALLEHQINLRDQRQCTELAIDGKRCRERRWLEFHHVIAVEKGGQDTLENLRTVCWAHHRVIHKRSGVSDHLRPYLIVSAR